MPRPNTRKDFWERVEKIPGGCWIWKHRISPLGYGRFDFHEKRFMAHRFAWTSYFGEIPDGMDVLHRCDNRLCVNPKHLFLGTQADNNRDRNEKNRQARGEKVNTCKLKDEDVVEIREQYKLSTKTKDDLAREFCVSRSNIALIIQGKTWKHIQTV